MDFRIRPVGFNCSYLPSRFRYIIGEGENLQEAESKGFAYLAKIDGKYILISELGFNRIRKMQETEGGCENLIVQPLANHRISRLFGLPPNRPVKLERLLGHIKRREIIALAN